MQTIYLATNQGPYECEAHIIGPFAIHLTYGSCWRITHLFTGGALPMDDVIGFDEACQVAREIAALPVDWYVGGIGYTKEYMESVRPIWYAWRDAHPEHFEYTEEGIAPRLSSHLG